MATVHLEVEKKYAAGPDVELPPMTQLLAALPEGSLDAGANASEGDVARHELRATYFDTADLRLAAAGLTLRRRTGGDDAGWHLKAPAAGGGRTEVRLPLGRATRTVPARLQRMVWAHTRGAHLQPVATIDTDRTTRRLVDATGAVLVEVADDLVTAQRLLPLDGSGDAAGSVSAWREIEVELVDGHPELLESLDVVLRDLGLRDAPSTSKLRQVLGAGDEPEGATGMLRRKSPAGDVVLAYVREQVEQIRRQDLPVRLDAPDSVHKMRVASRRLRSVLSTFKPLFDPAVVKPLRGELKWLAAELGAARDAEVMRDRLAKAVAAQDRGAGASGASVSRSGASAGGGIAAADVDAEMSGAYRQAHDRLLTELDGDRYHAVLGALDALVDQPPLTDRAARPAKDVLPQRVAKAYADLRNLMKQAASLPSGPEQEHLLHEARKAAKRARYAGEAVRTVFGESAAAFARAMEDLQEVLGEHQDSVVTRERLAELATNAPTTEAAFVYGRLHAFEELHGQRSAEAVGDAWSAARRKSLRRWLR